MRLYNQLSVLYIQYTKIYFQLNNSNFPFSPHKKKKLAWIYLKNHAVLRHCVFVDGCGYTFTLDGQKSWWGATGSAGRTAKCAANEDEIWPWQYHLSNVFLGSCWSIEYCVGFSVTFWHGRENVDPDKSVVFAYDGVPAHLDLAIPAPYVHISYIKCKKHSIDCKNVLMFALSILIHPKVVQECY